jgi:hypothetical protein
MTCHLLKLGTAFVLLTACGCSAERVTPPRIPATPETPPMLAPATPAADHPVQPPAAPADPWVYWHVDEGEADTVLVAVVSSGHGTRKHDVPLKRLPPRERPGEIVVEVRGITHGRLPDRDAICVHDSFAVADDPAPGVTVRLSSTSPRGGLLGLLFNAGGFNRRLTLPVGRPSEHRLSADATLAVSFREPKRVPVVPRVEPEWEKELARQRDDAATVPLPPAWGRN